MESEHRFTSLLQPIKDLTANWDINISYLLEEYLEELEDIKISLNNQNENLLNFAEAALLIQGSSLIYSRKVEYLYQLVFQVLDLLMQKKNEKKVYLFISLFVCFSCYPLDCFLLISNFSLISINFFQFLLISLFRPQKILKMVI